MAWKNGDFNGDGRADFVDYNIFLNEVDSKDDDSEYSFSDDPDLDPFMTDSSKEKSTSSPASVLPQNPLYRDPKVMGAYYKEIRMQREAAQKQEKKGNESRAAYYSEHFEDVKSKVQYLRFARDLFCYSDPDSIAGYIDSTGHAHFCSTSWRRSDSDLAEYEADEICQIVMNLDGIFMVRKNGSCIYRNIDGFERITQGCRAVNLWRDIKKIACDYHTIIGLRKDGTCVGTRSRESGYAGISDWKDIVDVACFDGRAVGLSKDGCVYLAGKNEPVWKDIYMIRASGDRMAVVDRNGHIDGYGLCCSGHVSSFAKDIVDLVVLRNGMVVLQSDGNIIGYKADGVAKKSCSYRGGDAVALYSYGEYDVIFLKENGKMAKLYFQDSNVFASSTSPVKQFSIPFSSYKDYATEMEAKIKSEEMLSKLREQRKANNLCVFCGGEFKKRLFSCKCSRCGQGKNY